MPRDAGQATIEYVAIFALVAIVIGATLAGAAVFAPGIANAVVGKFRQGLCVVADRACIEVAELPCVTRSARDTRRETLSIAVLRLGTERVVLRERLSDGTVRLTVLRSGVAGATAGFGDTARVKIGRTQVELGTHAQLTAAAILGRGQVYEVRSDEAADALVERLRASGSSSVDLARRIVPGGDDGPPAAETIWEGGLEGEAEASVSRSELSLGAGGEAEQVLGRRFDRSTGETTYYLRLQRGLSAFGDAMLATGSAELEGDALLAVTTDRDGRPKDLSALLGGHAKAGAATAGDLATAIGERGASTADTRFETEARVALTDPGVRAAFAAWRRAPASIDAVRRLGATLRTSARLDTRTYARETSSDEDGFAGAAGLRFGVGVEREMESLRLRSAATRPPGGLWEPRLDCVG